MLRTNQRHATMAVDVFVLVLTVVQEGKG